MMNLGKTNDCRPWKSIFSNGSYFSTTLCVAIATVATKERRKWFIQGAYLVLQSTFYSEICQPQCFLLLQCNSCGLFINLVPLLFASLDCLNQTRPDAGDWRFNHGTLMLHLTVLTVLHPN